MSESKTSTDKTEGLVHLNKKAEVGSCESYYFFSCFLYIKMYKLKQHNWLIWMCCTRSALKQSLDHFIFVYFRGFVTLYNVYAK